MKFWEAMKALEEGQTIYCKVSGHLSNCNPPITNPTGTMLFHLDSGGYICDEHDLMAYIRITRIFTDADRDDWEIYEDPKEK